MPVTVSVQIWVLFLYKKLNKLDLMVVFSHTVLYTVHYINAVTSPQPEVTLAYMVLGIQADCYCMIV